MMGKDRNASVWENFLLPPFPALEKNIKTEICIVGGGISGVSTAYQLALRGHQVTLVEGATFGSGQTSRTTAHLSYQLEKPLLDLLKLHSAQDLSTVIKAHQKAINEIEEIIIKEGIDCDFERLDGYLLNDKEPDDNFLIDEQVAASQCGLRLEIREDAPLLFTPRPALHFPRQAQFHPLKFLQGLLKSLQNRGVSLYENSKVTAILDIEEEDLKRVFLANGKEIEAKHLVIATNTPINNRFYIHTKQYAYRTYAIGLKIKLNPTQRCLLWDNLSPYHYVRFVDDLLVVGGEDHRTGQQPDSDPFVELESWARQNFTFVEEVAWKWSGQIFEPNDHLGFIGRNPGKDKNVYITTGEEGMGMTNAIIASLLIPDLIEEKYNSWASVFDPSRITLKGAGDYLKENLNVALQYKDWLSPSEVSSEADIPVDEGGLTREGFSKNCIYHYPDETFVRKSAVCTHLGGIVHWNDIEKTWDCPCHGSRFNIKGAVIEGPAISDLSDR